MSLFKREPRTVYRVYGEDEYFGQEQPAEEGGFEAAPPDAATDEGSPPAESARLAETRPEPDWERPPLPYRGPAPSRGPLAIGLLTAAVAGVLALVAVATLGGTSSRSGRTAAAATTVPDAVEAHGDKATTGGENSGAEGASRARARVRVPARVTMAMAPRSTRTRSRVSGSRAGSLRVDTARAFAGNGRASASLGGARTGASASVGAVVAGPGGETHTATPASQATAEFGFER